MPPCPCWPQYIEDTDRFPGWRGELPRMEVGVGDTVGFGELGQVRLTCDLPCWCCCKHAAGVALMSMACFCRSAFCHQC